MHKQVVECLNQQLGPCALACVWSGHSNQLVTLASGQATDNAVTSSASQTWTEHKLSHRSWEVTGVQLPALSRDTLLASAESTATTSGMGDDIPLTASSSTHPPRTHRKAENAGSVLHSAAAARSATDPMDVDTQEAATQQPRSAHQLYAVRGLHEWLGALACGMKGG